MSVIEERMHDISAADRLEIEAQLRRLLVHPLFQQSKYLPAFLAYIVQEALDPKSSGFLKERTVGVEVFGRRPDYDNNSDPVVRVTATALRKKLAQYYYENGHQDEIRIELHPGSYIPTFRPALSKDPAPESLASSLPISTIESAFVASADVPKEQNPAGAVSSSKLPISRTQRRMAAICCLAVVGIVCWVGYRVFGGDQWALNSFWSQMANSTDHISVVMPVIGSDDLGAAASVKNESARPVLSLEDTNLAARVSAELQRSKNRYQIVSAADITLADLRNGPAVLIGALDNVWTMRLSKDLPFFFEESPDNKIGRIVEASGNQHRTWSVDIDRPHALINRDYGIVARFEDHLTGQPTLIIAGISSQGTQAAGELLTSPEFREIRSIAAHAKNFEILLETDAIDGHSGQPKIVDSRVW